MPDLPGGPGGRDRALSEVVGYILVFSLIFLTVGFVSLSGLPTLDAAKESEQVQNAERAFDILDNNLEEIYKHGAPSRSTEISAESGTVELRDPVTINVSVTEATSGNVTYTNRQITPIVFTGIGATEYVYSAGAIFSQQPGNSFMISEPPFEFDDNRGFVTIVRTFSKKQISASGGTVLIRATSASRSVEVADTSLQETEYEQLTINVSDSPRLDSWEEYLKSELPNPDCTTGDRLSCSVDLEDEDIKQTFVTVQGIEIVLEL